MSDYEKMTGDKKISEIEDLIEIDGEEKVLVAHNGQNYVISVARLINDGHTHSYTQLNDLQDLMDIVDAQYQHKKDSTLPTESKEVSGAITEIYNLISQLNDEELESLKNQLAHIAKNHVYISEFDGTVQEAIDYCISNKCDLIINKDLVVTETLRVNNNNGLGCRIVGTKNRPTITLDSALDVPVFYFYGGSGSFSNTGIENITLVTTNNHLNTAIKINGVCNAKFNNISISSFKYGIHLCNDTSEGTFTELNTFNDINLNSNINGIRLEKLSGDDSFHGNSFVNVYMNIYNGQIGFNHVSGYYYNGNFRIYMWSLGEEATYLHCGGFAECNIGSITYESFKPGKITGSGRFWFRGNLTGIGGLKDETVIRSNGEKVISCDNYIKTISNSSVGYILSLSKGDRYNGVNDGIYSINNTNEKSFLVNGYDYGSDSKIYFGTTPYGCDLDKMSPGMHITLKGDSLKTYSPYGLTIYDQNGNKCAGFNNGAITGKVGNHSEVSISASSEIQTVTLTGGKPSGNIICLASVIIKGSNYEQRWLYSVNHDGYGNNGTCTKLATHYTLNAAGVEVKSITVDTNGNLVISILTDRKLTFITKYQGIGSL